MEPFCEFCLFWSHLKFLDLLTLFVKFHFKSVWCYVHLQEPFYCWFVFWGENKRIWFYGKFSSFYFHFSLFLGNFFYWALILRMGKAPFIDLKIANRPKCFQSSVTVEIGWSGSHKSVYTFMMSTRKEITWATTWEVLRFVKCLQIPLFLNNRCFAHFCGWRGRRWFAKLVIFYGHHKCLSPHDVYGNKSIL